MSKRTTYLCSAKCQYIPGFWFALFAGRVFYYLKSLIESIKQQFDSILSQVKDEVMAKRWL